MAEFDVYPAKMKITAAEMKLIQAELLSAQMILGEVANTLRIEDTLDVAYRTKIRARVNELSVERQKVGNLSSGLIKVADEFDNTEKHIAVSWLFGDINDALKGVGSAVSGGGNTSNPKTAEKKKNNFDLSKLLWDVVGKGGPIGGLIASVVKGIKTGSTNAVWEGIVKTGTGWAKAIDSWSGLAKNASKNGTKITWQELIGFNKNTKTASEAFTKSITKPVAWITALVDRGVDNWKEWRSGDISGGRALGELVLETGISVGETALLTAAATGAAALIGWAGAPAIVIGGVAAGAAWVIDGITEKFTGKKFVEWASDGIIDNIVKPAGEALGKAADAVVDGAKKAYDGAKKVIGDGAKAISDGISSAWSGFTSCFSF